MIQFICHIGTIINYIKETILLILYKISLSFFSAFKADILSSAGNKLKPNGYNIDKLKVIKVSLINIIWVLWYIEQKQEIKYQRKSINIKLITKKIIIFFFIRLSTTFDLPIAIFLSFSFFI